MRPLLKLKMRIRIFLTALLMVTLAAEDKYTHKYDSVDLDQILRSDRLLVNYLKCIVDKGPCTPDGSELKKNLPELLTNECQKCTEFQKLACEKIIQFLMEKEPDMWKQVEEKYDPDGIHSKKFLEERKKYAH